MRSLLRYARFGAFKAKRCYNPEEGLEQTARQFEALFVQMMPQACVTLYRILV